MSKSKFQAGRALMIGAIVSFVSFLILWAKHKSLAKAFLACSATSAIAGGALIHAYKKEEEAALESLYECSEEFEEILDADAQAEQEAEAESTEEAQIEPTQEAEAAQEVAPEQETEPENA